MSNLNEEIMHRFKYHPPTTEEKQIAHEDVRALCIGTALELYRSLPESREKSLAITKLEEVLFWANAAIARN
jgi:hypothetical protein